MKLLKTAFILLTAAVLPFALIAVGNPQEFTCWSLKPAENEGSKPIRCSSRNADDGNKDNPFVAGSDLLQQNKDTRVVTE